MALRHERPTGHTRDMRRVLTAATAALALAAGTAVAAGTPPSIRFVGLTPVEVTGAHFAAGERVRVTLRAGTEVRVRTVRASESGLLAVAFGTLRDRDRCSGSLAITALGARGDRAARTLPRMQCVAGMTALPGH